MISRTYDDIIAHEWLGSTSRPKMPLSARAKIFMPFAALRGYEELLAIEREKAVQAHEKKPSDPLA
ncbi:MAG: hypothetical protein K6G80_01560 [Treponema sp.]|nr:hypothetical protein [Treponema sp.]